MNGPFVILSEAKNLLEAYHLTDPLQPAQVDKFFVSCEKMSLGTEEVLLMERSKPDAALHSK